MLGYRPSREGVQSLLARGCRELPCRVPCASPVLTPEYFFFSFPVPARIDIPYRGGMGESRLTTYRISEAARELGISAEWLRVGERRGFFPPALRDRNGHRYYTEEDIERMRKRVKPGIRRRPRSERG